MGMGVSGVVQFVCQDCLRRESPANIACELYPAQSKMRGMSEVTIFVHKLTFAHAGRRSLVAPTYSRTDSGNREVRRLTRTKGSIETGIGATDCQAARSFSLFH